MSKRILECNSPVSHMLTYGKFPLCSKSCVLHLTPAALEMQDIENPDINAPYIETFWPELRKIRISKKFETSYSSYKLVVA